MWIEMLSPCRPLKEIAGCPTWGRTAGRPHSRIALGVHLFSGGAGALISGSCSTCQGLLCSSSHFWDRNLQLARRAFRGGNGTHCSVEGGFLCTGGSFWFPVSLSCLLLGEGVWVTHGCACVQSHPWPWVSQKGKGQNCECTPAIFWKME